MHRMAYSFTVHIRMYVVKENEENSITIFFLLHWRFCGLGDL